MSLFAVASRRAFFVVVGLMWVNSSAHALDLDWHGEFRAEENVIYGYTHGVTGVFTPTPTFTNNGYTIPNTGDSPSTFQDLFMDLSPRILLNDNVTIHSDIWLGLPDQSFFGSTDRMSRSYYSTNTGNVNLTAHSLFAEVATDFGTIRAGRIPLNWGLGLVWNSKDDGTERLPSSGDGISLLTKFGSFEISPTIVKYSDQTTNPNEPFANNNAGVSDYTLSIKYKNDDEQIDLGVLFLRRIAGINANVVNPFTVSNGYVQGTAAATPSTYGYAYNMWDFFAKKRASIFTFSAEVPLVSGSVAGVPYNTVAGALKATAQPGGHWTFNVNLGSASGQPDGLAGVPPNQLSTFSFHPDYRPGFILFNYNLRNLATNTGSIYDNPVTDAKFISFDALLSSGKWSHDFLGLYAIADKTCDGVAGNVCYNTQDRHYELEAGGAAQSSNLGFEVDYSLGYQWDESIRFGLDLGLYLPGKFYDFNNTATPNAHETVFASNLNLLVKF
jgi:hypothetical protein